jgi:hypothetical protein
MSISAQKEVSLYKESTQKRGFGLVFERIVLKRGGVFERVF